MRRLILEFRSTESDDETKHNKFYSTSKSKTVINKNDIDHAFELIYNTNISHMQNIFEKV